MHFYVVIAGLDPAIHAGPPLSMDHRVKPGGDEGRSNEHEGDRENGFAFPSPACGRGCRANQRVRPEVAGPMTSSVSEAGEGGPKETRIKHPSPGSLALARDLAPLSRERERGK